MSASIYFFFCHRNKWFIFYFLKLPGQQAFNTIRLVCTHGNFRGSEIRVEIKLLLLLQHLTFFPKCNTLKLVLSQVTDRQTAPFNFCLPLLCFPLEGSSEVQGAFTSRSNSLTSLSLLVCVSPIDGVAVAERKSSSTYLFWPGLILEQRFCLLSFCITETDRVCIVENQVCSLHDSFFFTALHQTL